MNQKFQVKNARLLSDAKEARILLSSTLHRDIFANRYNREFLKFVQFL